MMEPTEGLAAAVARTAAAQLPAAAERLGKVMMVVLGLHPAFGQQEAEAAKVRLVWLGSQERLAEAALDLHRVLLGHL
jgi:SpoU rRNA methylase family enzyme